MFSRSVNFKPFTAGVALVVLVGTHCLLAPLERGISSGSGAERFNSEQPVASAGHGGTLALLGGMRSMLANACWLRTNLAWERRDLAGTTAMIDLTVAADERPLYFWLNGARILANDMPEWRMTGPVPQAFRAMANEQQAQLALQFLEKGLRWHGPDAGFYV